MNPQLVKTRFKKINVHIGPGERIQGGGTMSVEVTAGLSKVAKDDRRVTAEVTIDIKGIPEKAKDESQYAFSAQISMQGVYEWAEKAPGDLNDTGLTNTLCQPLYVTSVSEIVMLVQRTGVGNISLPWTIDDNGKELPTKKSAAKKIASRKTKAAVAKPEASVD